MSIWNELLDDSELQEMARRDAARSIAAERYVGKDKDVRLEHLENEIDAKALIGGYAEAFEAAYSDIEFAEKRGQIEGFIFGFGVVLGASAVLVAYRNRDKIAAKVRSVRARFGSSNK